MTRTARAHSHFGRGPYDRGQFTSNVRLGRSLKPGARRITDLDATFSALGDPIRRAIVERLAQSGLSVSELARPFPVSLPAVSKHLKILEEAGLIRKEKAGRTITCRLNPSPLISTAAWISQYQPLWERQLEQLAGYLEEEKSRK